MKIDLAMTEALSNGPPEAALACVDVRAGLVLGVVGRSAATREVASAAATAAPQLCVVPNLDALEEGEDVEGGQAVIVSNEWVHAFVRVPDRPELVLVGVAKGGANVALLLAWVNSSSHGFGARA